MSRRLIAVAAVALLAATLVGCEQPAPDRVITYRIETRGPIRADLGQFGRHVAQTVSDPRGWSMGGAISFRQVTGPADISIVLATAASVPRFSSGCSSQWSCRVGRYVIINEERWLGATALWPYDLDSYQHYVVNHELGHWLGLGHWGCPGGFGTRSPVMAQQSKGGAALGSCRFNVWPTDAEKGSVGRIQRVRPRPTGLRSPDDPFGNLNRTTITRDVNGRPDTVRMQGWALDGDTSAPLGIIVQVDGRPVDIVRADRRRDDVARDYPRYGASHGFDVTVDVPPDAETMCVVAGGVGGGYPLQTIGCAVVK